MIDTVNLTVPWTLILILLGKHERAAAGAIMYVTDSAGS